MTVSCRRSASGGEGAEERGYCLWVTCPDQYGAFFVRGKSFGFDHFVFEVFEIFVIEVEASFQGAIRDPFFPLEQFEDLGEHLIEGHRCDPPFSGRFLSVSAKMAQNGTEEKD